MTDNTLFARPHTKKPADAIDDWVNPQPAAPSPQELKRLVIDIPAALKTRIDVYCATHGKKQKNVLNDILERAFANENPTLSE